MEYRPKTASEWQKMIEKCMKGAGTYREHFILPVKTLAAILEKRDKAEAFLEETGGEILVEHVNQGGNVYIEQNPAVRLINDLNRDALTYMRECGITPKGLKQICDAVQKEEKEDPLTQLIASIERSTIDYDEDGDPVTVYTTMDDKGNVVERFRKMTEEEKQRIEERGFIKFHRRGMAAEE